MQADNSENKTPENLKKYKITDSQWRLFFMVLVLGIIGIIYVLIRESEFKNSAALYIGLPVLLALGLSLTPKTKSASGATVKGITIALLLSAPVFQEGYICILFASPIFYLVGIFCAYFLFDRHKGKKDGKTKLQTAVVATLLAVMTLEGTSGSTSFMREHEVTVSKIVPATLTQVRETLSKAPNFGQSKPLFLRIFPYPVSLQGEGLELGDLRLAKFVAHKHIFWNRVEGEAIFTITESSERNITFSLSSDNSYVGHYVGWKKSEVELNPIDSEHTQVTWKLSFHRKYDPYWYFGTLQKYAVRLVAEELIDHAATPQS